MPNYFLYARKSTETEDKQVMSIDAQLTELRTLAKHECLDITQVFIEKQSAKTPGRPVFNDMMGRIEKGEASGIICWKLDRLARNPVDDGRIKWLLQTKVISKIITPERIYKPEDNALISAVEFGMANQYILDLSSNTKRGLREKVRRGWCPRLAPIGYLNDLKNKTIVLDKPKAKVIKAAFEFYAKGNSRLEDIAKFLHRHGLTTHRIRRGNSKGNLPYSKTQVSQLLSNPFYCGLFRYSGELHEGKHQPIIFKALFDKVQEVLKDKSRPHKGHALNANPFCGLIRCGECGCMITAEKRLKRQKNGNIHSYIYYHCTKKRGPCLQPCIRQEDLDNQLTIAFKDFVIPKEWVNELYTVIEREGSQAAQLVAVSIQELRLKVADIDRKLERLFQGYVNEILEQGQYQSESNKLKLDKKTITEQIARLEHRHNIWLEPLTQWIKDAEKLGEITLSPELHPKKSAAQKIFGSNLFLKNRQLQFSPQTQWAAIVAARQKIPQAGFSIAMVGTV